MKTKTKTLIGVCTAVVLVGSIGTALYAIGSTLHAEVQAESKHRSKCNLLGPHWANDIRLVSEFIHSVMPPDSEKALLNPSQADPNILSVSQELLAEAVKTASALDQERAKDMPHFDLYIGVRDQMRQRYYEFARFEERFSPAGVGASSPMQVIAEQQAIQMGVELCRQAR